MPRFAVLGLLLGLLLCPSNGFAGSVLSEGMIDKDLRYEGFEVTQDGYVMGYLVNTSNKTRQGFKVEMWITNTQETQIYWRKSITVGDLAPGARYAVKESCDLSRDIPGRMKFKFRLPNVANYRNQ